MVRSIDPIYVIVGVGDDGEEVLQKLEHLARGRRGAVRITLGDVELLK